MIEIGPLAAIKWELLAWSPPGWGGNLVWGLFVTFQIALGAYIFGLLLGLGGAMGKLYGGPITRTILDGYTTLVRAIPELVLILFLYYAGTDLLNRVLEGLGYGRITISGLIAGIYVLGFVQGAYSTEVFRGAIQAVSVGQVEAAKAYGMSFSLRFRRIILPAMLPFALPGLANLWLVVTKGTALLAVVGFSELALSTRQASGATKQYFLFFMAAGVLYLLLSLASTYVFALLERSLRRGQPKLG
ncbi:MAG: ABC transporter permease subunit [Hyphomicrobiaceae bacterium]